MDDLCIIAFGKAVVSLGRVGEALGDHVEEATEQHRPIPSLPREAQENLVSSACGTASFSYHRLQSAHGREFILFPCTVPQPLQLPLVPPSNLPPRLASAAIFPFSSPSSLPTLSLILSIFFSHNVGKSHLRPSVPCIRSSRLPPWPSLWLTLRLVPRKNNESRDEGESGTARTPAVPPDDEVDFMSSVAGPGDLYGAMSFFTGMPQPEIVTVSSSLMHVIMIPKEAYRKVTQRYPTGETRIPKGSNVDPSAQTPPHTRLFGRCHWQTRTG